MLLMNIGTEFINLFTQMHWVVVLLLGLGLVLCIVETAIPGFGIFGVLGILCAIAGVVTHAVLSGSAIQVLFLVLIIFLVIGLLFLIFIHSAKHGLLAKSAIVENKPSIPNDYREKTENQLKPLVGLEGLTLTECRPVGKVRIGQKTYEAQSKGSIIQKGEVVRVVSIEDARIMIDKIMY